MHPIHLRAETLLKQGRYRDVISGLRPHLADHSDDLFAQYLLSYALLLSNQLKESRSIAESLMATDPEQTHVVRLLAEIDIAEDRYTDAEAKANFLVRMDPGNVQGHLLVSRIKFLQRYYDAALTHIDRALELDPGSVEGLNLRIRITDMLGQYDKATDSIQELLNRDPENPTSLANLGMQKLNEGKVNEALEVFAQALAIQPTNMLARHGMKEALKSKFIVYRLFFQYQKIMSRLSGRQAWLFIIGTYLGAQIVSSWAGNMDGRWKGVMNAFVILIALTFFLSWVINPLMNLYLSTNKYGKLLLDDDEKRMSHLTGLSLLTALFSLTLFLVFGREEALLTALLFLGLMIPAGTYLLPRTKEKQKRLKVLGLLILAVGLLGISVLQASGLVFTIAILGLLAYQFYFNKLMISSFSRKFDG